MNGPTSSAPHNWRNVVRKAVAIWLPVGRRKPVMRIQDARMAVPATNGANFHDDSTLPPSEPMAVTLGSNGMYVVSGDQGPVQATTTAIRMANGISERITRPDRFGGDHASVPGPSPGPAPPAPPARPAAGSGPRANALIPSGDSPRPP